MSKRRCRAIKTAVNHGRVEAVTPQELRRARKDYIQARRARRPGA